MKIRKIALIMAVIFMFCTVTSYAKTLEFTIGSEELYISDSGIEQKTIDAKPYIENSRTMIPIRAVSENFGADVVWNEAERKVTISSDDVTIELFIGSDKAYVNGEENMLDTPAVIINSRTMVPLRFVSEALGKNVEYVSASRQILISDNLPIVTVDGVPITIDDVLAWCTLNGYAVEPSYAQYLVSQIVPQLTTYILFSNAAKNEGVVLEDSQIKELTDSLYAPENHEIIYSSSLMAPCVKFLSEDLLANAYLNAKASSLDPTTEEIENIYNNNYVRAKHILIVTQDMETGEKYSDEKLKDAKNAIEDIYKKLKAGEDFDKLMNEYCQDPGIATNPSGYVFTYGQMVEEFEKTAFELSIGEISEIVETPYGYHIIKKEALPPLDFDHFYAVSSGIQSDVTDVDIAISDIGNSLSTEKFNALQAKLLENAKIEELMTISQAAEILAGNSSLID